MLKHSDIFFPLLFITICIILGVIGIVNSSEHTARCEAAGGHKYRLSGGSLCLKDGKVLEINR